MGSMQALHVSVRSVHTVFPASPCQSQILLLNPVDQWMRRIPYHKRILFFNTHNGLTAISPFDLADTLKASLSETLVHFPPFAGRIRMRDDDALMELVCNGDGARFIEATADARLPDMNEFQPSPIFSPLAQTPGYDLRFPWKLEYPLLFVQVTSFEEGGFSVGVSFSHQIADGTSFWMFMRSWGEIARRLPISSHPQFRYGSLHHPPPPGGSKSENRTPRLYELMDAKQPLILGSSDVASRLFHFSPKAVTDLKLLGGESSKGRPFTTFEVVCAHIWQRGAIARELEDDQETKLLIAADLRLRHSSYPPNYFGNGAIFTAAIATAGELKAASLCDAANIIQKAISDFREEEMNDLFSFFLHETSFHFKEERPSFRMDRARDMIIRSSPRLRMYETDFGWGRPISVTFDVEGNHQGGVVFDGGREEGSLDITLSLSPKVMGLLMRDQAFFPNKR